MNGAWGVGSHNTQQEKQKAKGKRTGSMGGETPMSLGNPSCERSPVRGFAEYSTIKAKSKKQERKSKKARKQKAKSKKQKAKVV